MPPTHGPSLAIQQPGSRFVGMKTLAQQATLVLHRQRTLRIARVLNYGGKIIRSAPHERERRRNGRFWPHRWPETGASGAVERFQNAA
jgi:hypothetical protein